MQLGFTSVPDTPLGEQDCSGDPLEENPLTGMKGVTKVIVEIDTLIVSIIIASKTKDLIISFPICCIIYTLKPVASMKLFHFYFESYLV